MIPAPDPTHFLPGADVRRRPTHSMSNDELREQALSDLARGTDLIWCARIRLGALEDRGERVVTAYRAAVRATDACDRALAKAPRPT